MILLKQIESESSESVCATIMDPLTNTHTEQTEAAALEPRFSRESRPSVAPASLQGCKLLPPPPACGRHSHRPQGLSVMKPEVEERWATPSKRARRQWRAGLGSAPTPSRHQRGLHTHTHTHTITFLKLWHNLEMKHLPVTSTRLGNTKKHENFLLVLDSLAPKHPGSPEIWARDQCGAVSFIARLKVGFCYSCFALTSTL